MFAAKTVITESPSDVVVDDGQRTATLLCSAVTDPLTPLTIRWRIPANNASEPCATWRTVDERHQQVLVELDDKYACCDIECWASNGLSEDSRSATICYNNNTLSTAFSRGNLGWLGSRVVSVLDSGAEGPGFKSQSRRCRVTVLGKVLTPIVPLFTKQQNW